MQSTEFRPWSLARLAHEPHSCVDGGELRDQLSNPFPLYTANSANSKSFGAAESVTYFDTARLKAEQGR
jgi:hypothetical protein